MKNHIIPYDVVRRPRQLVGKGIVRSHEISLLHLAIVVRPGLRIAASGALGCLGISPREILVAALLVSLALYPVVVEPFARYLPAIGYIVADLSES